MNWLLTVAFITLLSNSATTGQTVPNQITRANFVEAFSTVGIAINGDKPWDPQVPYATCLAQEF